MFQVRGTEIASRLLGLPKLVSSETAYPGTKRCDSSFVTVRNHGGDNWFSTLRGRNREVFRRAGIPYIPLQMNGVSSRFSTTAGRHHIPLNHLASYVRLGTM